MGGWASAGCWRRWGELVGDRVGVLFVGESGGISYCCQGECKVGYADDNSRNFLSTEGQWTFPELVLLFDLPSRALYTPPCSYGNISIEIYSVICHMSIYV